MRCWGEIVGQGLSERLERKYESEAWGFDYDFTSRY